MPEIICHWSTCIHNDSGICESNFVTLTEVAAGKKVLLDCSAYEERDEDDYDS